MEILRINETHPSAYNQKYLVFLFGWHPVVIYNLRIPGRSTFLVSSYAMTPWTNECHIHLLDLPQNEITGKQQQSS